MDVFQRFNPGFNALGAWSAIKIPQDVFKKAFDTCIASINNAKVNEDITAAFSQVLKDSGLNFKIYEETMQRPLNDLASETGTSEKAIAADNVSEFTVRFNEALVAAKLLKLADQEKITDFMIDNQTPQFIFDFTKGVIAADKKLPAGVPSSSKKTEPKPKGMGTGTAILLGCGGLLAVGSLVYFATRKKHK